MSKKRGKPPSGRPQYIDRVRAQLFYERMVNDLAQMLRDQGIVDEPIPKKPTDTSQGEVGVRHRRHKER